MTQSVEESTREQVAVFLPRVLGKALASYHAFMDSGEVVDKDGTIKPKSFSEHHMACKAAAAHIELLLKLAQWAELPDSHSDEENLIEMIHLAQKDLSNYRKGLSNLEESQV